MNIQINDRFFSFPPFISVSWSHVIALSISPTNQLIIHLASGKLITLPEISLEQIREIFQAYASFLEKSVLHEPIRPNRQIKEKLEDHDFPLKFSFGTLEGMNSAMQHNPAQKEAPNLPSEMLEKIAEVSRILAPNNPELLPKAEPHCNCYHCQIARAITENTQVNLSEDDEEVPLKELQFEQWTVIQTGDQLFNVINKLDTEETYSVHLGHPIGCTCGKQNCEHIVAVLKT